MENINNFTYNDFKLKFDEITEQVFKIKTKKFFLSTKDINELDLLLEEAKSYKELFYSSNKRNYFSKIKIGIYIFLLQLEVNCSELYD